MSMMTVDRGVAEGPAGAAGDAAGGGQAAVLAELTARMEAVQERHRVDGSKAAKEFWAGLAGPPAPQDCAGSPVVYRASERDGAVVGGGSVSADAGAGAGAEARPGAGVVFPVAGLSSRWLVWCLGLAGSLRRFQEALIVQVLAEVAARGVEIPGGLRPVDWVRSVCPGLTAGQAREFVVVAEAVRQPRWQVLAQQVAAQEVSVSAAARIIGFEAECAPVADPEDLAGAVGDLMGLAVAGAPVEVVSRWVRHHTHQVRPPAQDEGMDARRRAARGVWFTPASATGMVGMRAVLDPEAAAVVKSAIEPLAAPCPNRDEDGHVLAQDLRSVATRRADALVGLVEQAVTAAGVLPVTDKARVVVTIDHDVLVGKVAGAGVSSTGEVLSASMARRIACDARVLPMVLGGASEPLDVGRSKRLVTTGMRTFLWQRDGGCSFPGCSAPPGWTDAHHVRPWWAGGDTAVSNLALLCRRHHTYVHRHGLDARITGQRVIWQV